MNATTGANGLFNVTVSFTVPAHSFGGGHTVVASNHYLGKTQATPFPAADIIGTGTFTVTPSLSLSFTLSSNTQQAVQTITNNGKVFNVTGQGLDPTTTYFLAQDNLPVSPSSSFGVSANGTGDLLVQMVAAGFRPGLHSLALYEQVAPGQYVIDAYVTFWVSPQGDFVLAALQNINATLTILNSSVNSLNTTVAKLVTSVGTLNMTLNQVVTFLKQINATIVALNGNVATLSTAIGTLQASLSALNTTITQVNGNVVSIKTAIGTLQGTVTSVSNGVATIQTNLGTINTTLSSIQSSASSANSNASTASNYSLYTLVLVIITLIVSIVAVALAARRPK